MTLAYFFLPILVTRKELGRCAQTVMFNSYRLNMALNPSFNKPAQKAWRAEKYVAKTSFINKSTIAAIEAPV